MLEGSSIINNTTFQTVKTLNSGSILNSENFSTSLSKRLIEAMQKHTSL